MPQRPPLVPELQRTRRRIWILMFGGAVLFIATVMLIAASSPPDTPANELITVWTFPLLMPSLVMVGAGMYVSVTRWRCPGCGMYLPTKFPVRAECPRCGTILRS
ncbi:MAG TPA: hypothetical protein VIW45_09785 [Vicinamibacterales bacterium]